MYLRIENLLNDAWSSIYYKVNMYICSCTPREGIWRGLEMYLHSFLTSELDGSERSASHHGNFTPREISPNNIEQMVVGPQMRSGGLRRTNRSRAPARSPVTISTELSRSQSVLHSA